MKRSLDEDEEQGGPVTKLSSPPDVFEWLKDFRKTRVVEMSHTQLTYPNKVIFHPTSSSWNLTDPIGQYCTEKDFSKMVDGMLDVSLEWAPGTELKKRLAEASYKSETFMGPYRSTCQITTKPSTSDMNELFGLLKIMLAGNYSNGPSKVFFKDMLARMLRDLSATGKFYVENPVPTSLSISRYIQMDEYCPRSPESIASSVQEEVEHFIVPDVIVYDKYHEYFALNIEIKKPEGSTRDALIQCFTQMLSQMHSQNKHFGLVVSAREWVLIMATKVEEGNKIYVRQFRKLMYSVVNSQADSLPVHLDVDAFVSLINWIYRILSWNMQGVYPPKLL